ncbi:MAG: ribulose-phosphate 3-epimerase [Bacteroidetes bacterium]|nr:MAG: ribulose-phosphate 3-epimerase [Bacteroidota bacterium]REK06966.1 MAG: ribulose-phosphate 3-epimerase [Bacteroidota bacterium]REK33686.1 MAG: ribulose-phosphate 3-epimerase [Bacteroidota bacterium]REK47237.1 MAG: ribulose-phosphate 3-epimerase [Bacteroidota bacterium]
MAIIAPSILSADFANLQRDIEMINKSKADWFHIDIMDGVFVPNISFGFPVLSAIAKHAKKPLDVHLMIVQPEKYITRFRDAGANVLTVHLEACPHLHRCIQEIKQAGMQAGVAINPHTPVSMLEDIISEIDLVCMMSVNPGFGGQKFIDHTFEKCRMLNDITSKRNVSVKIEIDGGVDLINAAALVKAGADVLVAGNTVFSSKDPLATIEELKSF